MLHTFEFDIILEHKYDARYRSDSYVAPDEAWINFHMVGTYPSLEGFSHGVYLLYGGPEFRRKYNRNYNQIARVKIDGTRININTLIREIHLGSDPYTVVPYILEYKAKKNESMSVYIRYALEYEQYNDEMTRITFWENYMNFYIVYIYYEKADTSVLAFNELRKAEDFVQAFKLTTKLKTENCVIQIYKNDELIIKV